LPRTRYDAEAASHIGVPGGEPYPYIAGARDHRRSSTSTTRASAAASTLASTGTRRPPPRLISISPLRPPAPARDCPLVAELAASADASAIRTAQKRGATGAVFGFARDCRRQVNTKLAERPCRRATSHTFAPGASVSSTMRALSSRDQVAAAPHSQELQPASVDLKASVKTTRLSARPSSARRSSSVAYAATTRGSSWHSGVRKPAQLRKNSRTVESVLGVLASLTETDGFYPLWPVCDRNDPGLRRSTGSLRAGTARLCKLVPVRRCRLPDRASAPRHTRLRRGTARTIAGKCSGSISHIKGGASDAARASGNSPPARVQCHQCFRQGKGANDAQRNGQREYAARESNHVAVQLSPA
jgi:hypothetical protein